MTEGRTYFKMVSYPSGIKDSVYVLQTCLRLRQWLIAYCHFNNLNQAQILQHLGKEWANKILGCCTTSKIMWRHKIDHFCRIRFNIAPRIRLTIKLLLESHRTALHYGVERYAEIGKFKFLRHKFWKTAVNEQFMNVHELFANIARPMNRWNW